MKAPGAHPLRDPVLTQAEAAQLRPADHAVLALRNGARPRINAGLGAFSYSSRYDKAPNPPRLAPSPRFVRLAPPMDRISSSEPATELARLVKAGEVSSGS